ncbi:MAG: alginate export family protein [Cyclobacteriaceae bacterium]
MNRLLTLLLMIGSVGSIQAQLTLSGEFRPRSEYRHGFATLAVEDQDPAFFVEQRSRLNTLFVQEKYSIKIVFQDVRTWGSQSQLVNNDGSLTTVHEAWGSLRLSVTSNLKIGRQEIILDDSRLFGNVAWAQQARSHDAILFENAKDDFSLKLAAAYNQDGPQISTNYYSIARSYKTLQFLWLKKKLGSLNTSFLFLNNGLQSGTPTDGETNFSQTVGTNIDLPLDQITPGGSIYYQTGKDGAGNDINALQYQLDLNYKANDKTNFLLGYEVLSGNDETSTSTDNKAFNPFYGTNHKFNGLMDYFYVGNHAGSVGLRDLFVQIVTNGKKWKTQASVHYFSSHSELLDPVSGTAADKYLGTEVDLVFSHQSSEDVNIKIGYSQMFGGSSMEILKGGDSGAMNNWSWVMLTIKPTFFTTKSDEG